MTDVLVSRNIHLSRHNRETENSFFVSRDDNLPVKLSRSFYIRRLAWQNGAQTVE
jgi:hypothetical protein